MSKPFVITEDQYNHDKMSWAKKEFIVYDNVCTPPVIFYTLDDKTVEGFIGKELLMKAREMVPDERMYVRNPVSKKQLEALGYYLVRAQAVINYLREEVNRLEKENDNASENM